MSHRFLSNVKLLVVVFPIGAGLFLTILGAVRLNQANVTVVPRTLAPYGVQAFSVGDCQMGGLDITFTNVIVDENRIDMFLRFDDVVFSSNSSYEETFGFQIPYEAEITAEGVTAFNNLTKSRVDVEVTDKNATFAENDTSIVYIRFVVSPELNQYDILIAFFWKDAIVRQGFSAYELIVPVSWTDHNVFQQHLPEVHLLHCPHLSILMRLPTDIVIGQTIPPPDLEWYLGEPNRYLEWRLEDTMLGKPQDRPMSMVIRVPFELLQESELRGRLLFDSGLYMGIGIGLLISGVHEALKYTSARSKGRATGTVINTEK